MSPDQPLVPQPTEADFPEFLSIPVRVARNAALYPDKPAVKCEGRARNWGDFDRRVNRIARSLAGMGIGMITKGRMAFTPKRIRGIQGLKAIIARAKELEATHG